MTKPHDILLQFPILEKHVIFSNKSLAEGVVDEDFQNDKIFLACAVQ